MEIKTIKLYNQETDSYTDKRIIGMYELLMKEFHRNKKFMTTTLCKPNR